MLVISVPGSCFQLGPVAEQMLIIYVQELLGCPAERHLPLRATRAQRHQVIVMESSQVAQKRLWVRHVFLGRRACAIERSLQQPAVLLVQVNGWQIGFCLSRFNQQLVRRSCVHQRMQKAQSSDLLPFHFGLLPKVVMALRLCRYIDLVMSISLPLKGRNQISWILAGLQSGLMCYEKLQQRNLLASSKSTKVGWSAGDSRLARLSISVSTSNADAASTQKLPKDA